MQSRLISMRLSALRSRAVTGVARPMCDPLLLSSARLPSARQNRVGVPFWRACSTSLIPARPSSFRESQEQVALSERQEAILIERLPRDWTEDDLRSSLHTAGVNLGENWQDSILLMRSRLGVSMGRALISVTAHVPHVKNILPVGTTYRPMDHYDIEAFVEQCERFVNFSDDIRRLAQPANFLRVITITEVPSTYGRKDIAHVIQVRCGVTVDPRDVVFRFKRWGRQSDTCYVVCPSEKDANHCISQIQELAVPKRAAYGSLFGAAFLWSSRSSLFVCHPNLDFSVESSKFWVFTTGWQEDMEASEFLSVMNQLQFYPHQALRHHMEADNSSAFFMEFRNMDKTKRAMSRLRRLKWRWRMKQEMPFFAYPRRVDIHRASEEVYEDEDSAADSDIEEPVHY